MPARQGARRLCMTAIGLFIVAMLGIVLHYGDILDAVVNIILFSVVLSGWRLMRQEAPELSKEELATWDRNENWSIGIRYCVIGVLLFLLFERGEHILLRSLSLEEFGFNTCDVIFWGVSLVLVWLMLVFSKIKWSDWGRVGGVFFLFSLLIDIVLYMGLDFFSGVEFENEIPEIYIDSMIDMAQSTQLFFALGGLLLWGGEIKRKSEYT